MSKKHFITQTIAVHLEIDDGQPKLTIFDNPHVPGFTVATLAWVATARSLPFEFAGFEWENTDNAVTDPVMLGPGMTALASNNGEIPDDVELPYRLAVTTPSLPGHVIWSSGSGAKPVTPIAELKNIIATLRFRMGSWSPWRKPEEPLVGAAASKVDPGTSTPPPPHPELLKSSSGPMIILTRV